MKQERRLRAAARIDGFHAAYEDGVVTAMVFRYEVALEQGQIGVQDAKAAFVRSPSARHASNLTSLRERSSDIDLMTGQDVNCKPPLSNDYRIRSGVVTDAD